MEVQVSAIFSWVLLAHQPENLNWRSAICAPWIAALYPRPTTARGVCGATQKAGHCRNLNCKTKPWWLIARRERDSHLHSHQTMYPGPAMNKGDVKIYWPININAPMTFKLAYFCKRLLLRALRRLRRTVYTHAIFAIQVFGATARINVAKLTPHYYVCLCCRNLLLDRD